MASHAILSNFLEERWTQNYLQYLSGLSRALFATTFLEIALYTCTLYSLHKQREHPQFLFWKLADVKIQYMSMYMISITNDGYRLLVYQLTTPGLIYIKTITTKTFFFQEVCIVADHVKQTCKFHAIFYGPPRSAAASKLWNTSSPCLVLGSEVLVSSPRSVQ